MFHKHSVWLLGWAWMPWVCYAAETQSWEIRGEYVSLKAGDAEVAILRTAGGLVEVPLAALSEANRAAIGKLAAVAHAPQGNSPLLPEGLAEDLAACPAAADACDICRLALAGREMSAVDRAAVKAQLVEFEARAARGEVRFGKEWVAAEVARAASEKAAMHLSRATEMLRLGNAKLAEQELNQASEADPSSGLADFIIGLAFILQGRPDYDKASASFEEVIRRQPANGPAWNNLAVCNAERRRYKEALSAFQVAAEAIPGGEAVIANLAILIRFAAERRSRIPPRELESFTALYHELAKTRGPAQAPAPSGPVLLAPTGASIAAGAGADFVTLMSTGVAAPSGRDITGVVVAPDRVVCVVPDEPAVATGGLMVEVAAGQALPAQKVAATPDGCLVLLKCEGLGIAPLPLAVGVPQPDQQVMIVEPVPGVGQPGQQPVGTVTAATVLALDAAAADRPRFVFEVGSGGGQATAQGPGAMIVDAAGRLAGLSVRQPVARRTAGAKSLAVPVDVVRLMLKQSGATLESKAGPVEGVNPGGPEAAARAQTAVVRVRTGPPTGQAP